LFFPKRAEGGFKMAISFRGNMNIPNIVCLSSDVSAGIIAGSQPGMTIYYSDLKAWKIVKNDLTLADYVLPFGASVDIGDVTLLASTAIIGTVGIDQTTTGTTNGVSIVNGVASGTSGVPAADVITVQGISGGTGLPASLLAGTAAIGTVSQTPVACAAVDVHAPAVNTAAVVTYAGDPAQKHVISGIAWSYTGGTPVGGSLQITDGGAVVFIVDIDKSGPGGYEFPRPKMGMATNSAMVITLAAAGAGITGKVSIENHWLV
jgi:hypothetical protein